MGQPEQNKTQEYSYAGKDSQCACGGNCGCKTDDSHQCSCGGECDCK